VVGSRESVGLPRVGDKCCDELLQSIPVTDKNKTTWFRVLAGRKCAPATPLLQLRCRPRDVGKKDSWRLCGELRENVVKTVKKPTIISLIRCSRTPRQSIRDDLRASQKPARFSQAVLFSVRRARPLAVRDTFVSAVFGPSFFARVLGWMID